MGIMQDMIESGSVKDKSYIKSFESIFLSHAELTDPSSAPLRIMAVRGLRYFADPEARQRARGALNDSNPMVRQEALSTIKAQEALANP